MASPHVRTPSERIDSGRQSGLDSKRHDAQPHARWRVRATDQVGGTGEWGREARRWRKRRRQLNSIESSLLGERCLQSGTENHRVSAIAAIVCGFFTRRSRWRMVRLRTMSRLLLRRFRPMHLAFVRAERGREGLKRKHNREKGGNGVAEHRYVAKVFAANQVPIVEGNVPAKRAGCSIGQLVRGCPRAWPCEGAVRSAPRLR
jgi:hypothetical protein